MTEQKSIEYQVGSATQDAFLIMFSDMSEEDRTELLKGIVSIDVEGEPIGRVLLGILLATHGVAVNLTGQEVSLTSVARNMLDIAERFDAVNEGGE